jgi:4-azaleucine resistance transporter AzlC
VVGTTFGVVARQAGLTPLEIAGMSLLIFAGASQFAMVQLATVGAPAPVVIATVLFLNLRHLLMAASLRGNFARVSPGRRLAAAFFLTDESFAMATGYFRRGGTALAYYVTFAVTLFVLWNAATLAGVALGNAIGEPRRLGVDFAITATFLGIVVLGIRRLTDAIVALAAAAGAGALALAGASTIAVIVAGALAPILAVVLRRR